ncbi:hypothetical protein [Saccharothrix lopnurensis]|uniref:DUF4429 domain-containing protein n=1 Tax=Saccharothrix lopnurensis TaxID=1670621 RepID=A0ABW1NWZ1_9PSEU
MTTRVEPRASTARCYKCGSPEIATTCHHCGRLICREDGRPTGPDEAPAKISQEFAGLGMDTPQAHHCETCDHVVPRRLGREQVIAGAVAALGALLLPVHASTGVVVLLIGLAGLATCYLVDRRRVAEAQRHKPRLPLLPKIDSASVRETVRGKLVLDAGGHYRMSIEPPLGELGISTTFARTDLDRLTLYRTRYRLPADSAVDYCAGFAVLKGKAGMTLTNSSLSVPVIPLSGRTDEHQFFSPGADGRSPAKWELKSTYSVSPDRVPEELPLWLTPSVMPRSDQRTLELTVQWEQTGPADNLKIDKVEPVVLHVPVEWGKVERTTHSPVVGRVPDPRGGEGVVQRIEWNRVALTEQDREAGQVKLIVRFEDKIQMNETIHGSVRASFRGTLSGLTGLRVLSPLGEARSGDTGRSSARTDVQAEFELSLAGIRYQDVRVVPDNNESDRPEAVEFAGVIPDHETVSRLTGELSEEGYYIKRVIEHPPHASGKANVMNRYWDIAGRRYDGVYPLDFSLSLTGEELHTGDIRAQSGSSRIRLSVQAVFANEQMKRAVEAEWDRLDDTIRRVLGSASDVPRAYSGDPRAAVPNGHGGQNGHGGSHGDGVHHHESDARHDRGPGVPGGGTTAGYRHGGSLRRAPEEVSPRLAELHRQRNDLIRRFSQGKISDEGFRLAMAAIDDQLDND